MSEALVGIADWNWSRRGGRSAGSAQLAVHLADVRQRERAGLVRLEGFVQEAVLSRTYPLATAAGAGGLCTARMLNADGDFVVCTRDAGHYDWTTSPSFEDGEPGGWHEADASMERLGRGLHFARGPLKDHSYSSLGEAWKCRPFSSRNTR
ncbi:hypothetical protein AB0D35_17910 [Streptomyces sp. NPDC048301]|uniref:hypothetical protein n=1 Tax=Streptomyces sp. NPDC048301 TaxID=3155631 RepID=UPI003425D751